MGFIKLDRRIMSSWLWTDKPFSMGQAWIDLLLLANWKDARELYNGEIRERKRGTVACSKKWLAERWGWDRKKVSKFLSILEADKMVTTEGSTHGTTVHIENWDKYQLQGSTDGTTDDSTDAQPMRNHSAAAPHTKEGKENKDGKKKAENDNRLEQIRKDRDRVVRRWRVTN